MSIYTEGISATYFDFDGTLDEYIADGLTVLSRDRVIADLVANEGMSLDEATARVDAVIAE